MSEDAPTQASEELAVSLRLARREVKFVRRQQEEDREVLQNLRRQHAAMCERVEVFSQALAKLLSDRYRDTNPPAGEAALVAKVEECELFDAGWYLSHHPEIVEDGVGPAVHYVRTGGAAGLDPGPDFATEKYLADHPEAREANEPPLVHYLRTARR